MLRVALPKGLRHFSLRIGFCAVFFIMRNASSAHHKIIIHSNDCGVPNRLCVVLFVLRIGNNGSGRFSTSVKLLFLL